MRKFLVKSKIVLILAVCLAFSACGNKKAKLQEEQARIEAEKQKEEEAAKKKAEEEKKKKEEEEAAKKAAEEEAAKKAAEEEAAKKAAEEEAAKKAAEEEAAKKAAAKATKTTQVATAQGDNAAPIMFSIRNNSVLTTGGGFDLNNYVGYGDDNDPTPQLTYSGYIDPNTVGDYPLHGVVTDNTGKSTEFDITILVRDPVPGGGGGGGVVTGTAFSDYIAGYKTANTSIGIDVSKWQGNIDFSQVRNAGCEFVIIRMGYTDKGQPLVDPYFEQNYANAVANGLSVGVYIHTVDNTVEKARNTAVWAAQTLNGRRVDFPIAYDWEQFGKFQRYGMSLNTLNNGYAAFNDELVSRGYSTMVYGSKNYLNLAWYPSSKQNAWLAHYTSQTNYSGPYCMWQLSSSGIIPGIAGRVDVDVLYH